tara:strand:- start:5602 stop:6090 length:489 start_codon:yes stop_codon:yes gene_type:complete
MPLSEASNPIKLLAVVGLLISPWLFTQVGIAILAPDEKIEIMPTCEKDSGNCAHLGGGETYRMESSMATLLEFNSTTIWQNLLDYIEDNDGTILVETITDSNYYIHFVEKTPFWNFPDDVVIEITDYNGSCSIEMHSHSRLGKGDIGVNPDRLNGIYDVLVN